MKLTTYLIVPAETELAGRCRIVARAHEGSRPQLADYRNRPELWREAGHISSQGKLLSLDAPFWVFSDMQSCEPIWPPTTFTYGEAPQ